MTQVRGAGEFQSKGGRGARPSCLCGLCVRSIGVGSRQKARAAPGSLVTWLHLVLCLLAAMAGGLTACDANDSGPKPIARSTPVTDAASFVERLRAMGLQVESDGEVEQPFFSVNGTMVKVNGEDVQLFEYSDAAAADAQAALVSPDGASIGTAKPFWVGSPHFYKSGRLLVLYVGDDTSSRRALEAVLGRQFAGKGPAG